MEKGFWRFALDTSITSLVMALSNTDSLCFWMICRVIITWLGHLELTGTFAFFVIYYSLLFFALIIALDDALTSQLSTPLENRDLRALKRVFWVNIQVLTVYFLVLVAIPSFFVKSTFDFADVHSEIAGDVYKLVIYSLPSIYIIGLSDTIKGFYFNFGEVAEAGWNTVLAIASGSLAFYLLIAWARLGLWGIIISSYIFALISLFLQIRTCLRVVKSYLEEEQSQEHDSHDIDG